MRSSFRMLVLVSSLALCACPGPVEKKDKCSTQADCLTGYSCSNGVCLLPAQASDDGGDGDGGAADFDSGVDPCGTGILLPENPKTFAEAITDVQVRHSSDAGAPTSVFIEWSDPAVRTADGERTYSQGTAELTKGAGDSYSGDFTGVHLTLACATSACREENLIVTPTSGALTGEALITETRVDVRMSSSGKAGTFSDQGFEALVQKTLGFYQSGGTLYRVEVKTGARFRALKLVMRSATTDDVGYISASSQVGAQSFGHAEFGARSGGVYTAISVPACLTWIEGATGRESFVRIERWPLGQEDAEVTLGLMPVP